MKSRSRIEDQRNQFDQDGFLTDPLLDSELAEEIATEME